MSQGKGREGGRAVSGLDTAQVTWLTSMSHADSLGKDISLILRVGRTERLGDYNKITCSVPGRADTNNPRPSESKGLALSTSPLISPTGSFSSSSPQFPI